jgi:hypothetical protein
VFLSPNILNDTGWKSKQLILRTVYLIKLHADFIIIIFLVGYVTMLLVVVTIYTSIWVILSSNLGWEIEYPD